VVSVKNPTFNSAIQLIFVGRGAGSFTEIKPMKVNLGTMEMGRAKAIQSKPELLRQCLHGRLMLAGSKV